MQFIYGKQDFRNLKRAQENCFLLTNGLGGYSSLSLAYSAARGDHGILISASQAPSVRETLVHRVQEYALIGGEKLFFSSQEFAGERVGEAPVDAEEGYLNLSFFQFDPYPTWLYERKGISLRRQLIMDHEKNQVLIHYELNNLSGEEISFHALPAFICAPKGEVRRKPSPYLLIKEACNQIAPASRQFCLKLDGRRVYIRSDIALKATEEIWEKYYYEADEICGRDGEGMALRCLDASLCLAPGEYAAFELVFSDQEIREEGEQIRKHRDTYEEQLDKQIPYKDPLARVLARSADAYISRRDSTGGKTIVAGYPFFADWGRDTMIALPGCVLAFCKEEENRQLAKSILETFLAYEKGGLVPNLFPEGGEEPRYNTVDAALLLINCVWLYYEKTGDLDFVSKSYPVMERIIEGYKKGTEHGICMDSDGLIKAGKGLDQVTWMDVCVNGILPTPRHGKPVEVNAYWYNALKIMESFAGLLGEVAENPEERVLYEDKADGLRVLGDRVRASFTKAFWMEEKGYLKDLVSGEKADEQLRCNQIWAVTMPFSMLSKEQEKRVVERVYRELYTPCGLRTLSPADAEFKGVYEGAQLSRDLAYHQGTVWVYPLGAFYRAYLKLYGESEKARAWVRERLLCLEPMLREGCVGQLPEIYDGLNPADSKGCFAQAWSVGEILTVYEILEDQK